jgi:hypothetical protein
LVSPQPPVYVCHSKDLFKNKFRRGGAIETYEIATLLPG